MGKKRDEFLNAIERDVAFGRDLFQVVAGEVSASLVLVSMERLDDHGASPLFGMSEINALAAC
jgi:hypothetical protein